MAPVLDTMLVDPATLTVSATWPGCHTGYVSPKGSFACAVTPMTVHLADGSTHSIVPISPVTQIGWIHVDDAGNRAVFGVIHSRGQGMGGCPCVIDTESAGLSNGVSAKIADQMLPLDILPDGRIFASSAPALPELTQSLPTKLWVLAADGTQTQVATGPRDFIALVRAA
jgi:hypothetical protein